MIAPYKNGSDERYINYGNYDSLLLRARNMPFKYALIKNCR